MGPRSDRNSQRKVAKCSMLVLGKDNPARDYVSDITSTNDSTHPKPAPYIDQLPLAIGKDLRLASLQKPVTFD